LRWEDKLKVKRQKGKVFEMKNHLSSGLFITALLGVFIYFCGETTAAQRGSAERMVRDMKINITSAAFKDKEVIPAKYTGDGEDFSPPLEWSSAPQGTKSFAIISDDPDAPFGTWVHWVLFNIPQGAASLPEHVPAEKILSPLI